MSFSVRSMAIDSFAPMLDTLSTLLDQGAEYCGAQGEDLQALLDARLAPDMYPLSRQVQLACHHAEDAVARLTEQAPPPNGDNGHTLDRLKQRIKEASDYVRAAGAAQFNEERQLGMPLSDQLRLEMKGFEFLRDWALPHFYFHIVTAYGILRHRGVPVGKTDYLGHIGYAIRPAR